MIEKICIPRFDLFLLKFEKLHRVVGPANSMSSSYLVVFMAGNNCSSGIFPFAEAPTGLELSFFSAARPSVRILDRCPPVGMVGGQLRLARVTRNVAYNTCSHHMVHVLKEMDYVHTAQGSNVYTSRNRTAGLRTANRQVGKRLVF